MKPKAWSYSALNSFLNCPRQYYEMSVAKNYPYVQGQEAAWGDRVHKLIEDHICVKSKLQDSDELNTNMKNNILNILARFDRMGCSVVAEGKSSLNQKLKPCGYFDKNTWVRCILDLLVFHPNGTTATIIDWKTGKVRPDTKQLKLFALMVFYQYPKIDLVETRFEWLAHSDTTQALYRRDQMGELWAAFIPDLKKFREAFLTDDWPARRSGLCQKYCDVISCEHNGRNS